MLAAARQSARQQHACTHTAAAQPAPLRQHWIFAHRVQQGLQEPPHAGIAAPQCKPAAEHSELGIELSVAQSLRVRSCAQAGRVGAHRIVRPTRGPCLGPSLSTCTRPAPVPGQQLSLPASCSPSATDPEHPAQPLGCATRLAVVQLDVQRPPASTLIGLCKVGASLLLLFVLHWRAPKVGCSSMPFSCAKAPS
jgi:hypothetical protein